MQVNIYQYVSNFSVISTLDRRILQGFVAYGVLLCFVFIGQSTGRSTRYIIMEAWLFTRAFHAARMSAGFYKPIISTTFVPDVFELHKVIFKQL